MKSIKEKIYEIDLYQPIQKYFTKLGYEVRGEVKHCDLTAVKDDELVIVEMKLNLNIDLLIQATKRQRLTDLVYIAIPKPKYSLRSKKWNDLCHLIKRLELGLIIVSIGKRSRIDVVFSPTPFDRKKSMQYGKRSRKALLEEIEGRHADYNTGGSSKTKIMTSYKENCIQIACYLERFGPSSPKDLVSKGTGKKTQSILNMNYYQWFEKIKRGVYCLSDKGKKELEEFPELVQYYTDLIETSIEEKASEEND